MPSPSEQYLKEVLLGSEFVPNVKREVNYFSAVIDQIIPALRSLVTPPLSLEKIIANLDFIKQPKNANQIFDQLLSSNDIFIRGGAHNKQHLIYRLIKEQKKVKFLVYNAGEGIQYHEHNLAVYGFAFPIDAGYEQRTKRFIEDLLFYQKKPQDSLNKAHSIHNVYEAFFAARVWLGAGMLSHKQLKDYGGKVKGNPQGDSLVKTILQIIKPALGEQFYPFLFKHRLELMQQAINLPDMFAYNRKRMLSDALANMSRMLLKNKCFFLAGEKAESEQQLLALQTSVSELAESLPNSIRIKPETTTIQTVEAKQQPVFNILQNQQIQPLTANFFLDPNNFLRSLQALVNLTKDANAVAATRPICDAIEQFCITFCRPELGFNPVSAEFNAFQKIQAVLSFYQTNKGEKLTPRSFVVQLAMMCVAERLAAASQLSIAPLYCEKINWLLSIAPRNAYLGTMDPTLDQLLHDITAFYQPITKTETCDYLKNLINSHGNDHASEIRVIKDKWLVIIGDNINFPKEKKGAVEGILGARNSWQYAYLSLESRNSIKGTDELNRKFDVINQLKRIVNQVINSATDVPSNRRCCPDEGFDNVKSCFSLLTRKKEFSDQRYQKQNVTYQSTFIPSCSGTNYCVNPNLQDSHNQTARAIDLLHEDFDGQGKNSQEIASLGLQVSSPRTYYSEKKPREARLKKEFFVASHRSPEEKMSSLHQYIKAAPHGQVMLTLSQLIYSVSDLSDSYKQQRITQLVFQPGALLSTLRQAGDIWRVLDDLHARVHVFNDVAYTGAGENFFLTLAARISVYALRCHESDKIVLNVQAFDSANRWCNIMREAMLIKSQNKEASQQQQRALYCDYINVIVTTYSTNHLGLEDLKRLLGAYFRLNMLPKGVSLVEEEQVDAVLAHCYRDFLIKFSSNLLDKAQKAALSLMFNGTSNITADLATANVFVNGNTLGYLPDNALSRIEFKELFGEQNFYAVSFYTQDKAFVCYQFESYQSVVYRLFLSLDASRESCCIKKWVDNKYYTYAAPTDAIAKKIGFTCHAFETAPTWFAEENNRVWIADDDCYYIVSREHPKIEGARFQSTSAGLFRNIEPRGTVNLQQSIPEILLRFESRAFIQAIGKDRSGAVSYYFLRYGFSVEQRDNEFYMLEGYRLTKEDDHFASGWVLEKDGKRFYRVAVATYAEKHTSIRLNWQHDFGNYAQTGNSDGTMGHYCGTQRYAEFELNSDNCLMPSQNESQLYAVYLESAYQRYEQAFELLSRYVLQGTQQEATYLWWIVSKMPATSAERVPSPALIAIQLLAIARLLELRNQLNFQPRFSTDANKKSEYYRCQENQFQSFKDFFEAIAENANHTLLRYQQQANNIPKKLQLSQASLQAVYRYCEVRKQLHGEQQISQRVINFNPNGSMSRWADDLKEFTCSDMLAAKDAKWQKSQQLNMNAYRNPLTVLLQETSNKLSLSVDVQSFRHSFHAYYLLAKDRDDACSYGRQQLARCCQIALSKASKLSKLARNGARTNDPLRVEKALVEMIWVLLKVEATDKSWLTALPKYFEDIGRDTVSALANRIKLKFNRKLPSITAYQLEVKTSGLLLSAGGSSVELPIAFTQDQLSPVIENTLLDGVISTKDSEQLTRHQEIYQGKRKEIFKKLEELSAISYDKRIEVFTDCDKELLAALQKKEAEQAKLLTDGQEINVESQLTQLREKVNTIKAEITSFLNASKSSRLPELARARADRSLENLLNLYPSATEADYGKHGILSSELPEFKQQTKALMRAQANYSRLLEFQQAMAEKDYSKAANLLFINSAISDHPLIALFQYQHNIVLRPEQLDLLELVLKLSPGEDKQISLALQLIMGGGKTSVILPILLRLFADGKHLVVVVVPEKSFKTNRYELSETIVANAGQTPVTFMFKRNPDITVAELSVLQHRFETAMQHGNCVITTRSALQTLDSTFTELLYERQKNSALITAEHDKKLHHLASILQLLEKNGIAVVDEGHEEYDIKHEHNFSLGDKEKMDHILVKNTVKLYKWLAAQTISLTPEEGTANTYSLNQLIMNPSLIADPATLKNVIEQCASKLRDDKKWTQKILPGSLSSDDLYAYIRNKTTDKQEKTINDAINSNPSLQKQWAFLRAQFATLLPITLSKKLYEDYGPVSTENSHSTIQNYQAIPFAGNNKPVVGSIFGDPFVKNNLTVQMTLPSGVPYNFLLELLKDWKNQISQEQNPDSRDQLTENIQKKYKLIFDGYSNLPDLLALDLDRDDAVQRMHQSCYKSPYLFKYFLQANLAKIEFVTAVLRNNSVDFAGMVNQVITLSGTMANSETFHDKIEMQHATRLLSESLVMSFLQKKQAAVVVVEDNSPTAFCQQFLTDQYQNARAIIDCGALFTGIKNREVAEVIVTRLRSVGRQAFSNVKYVLFYQDGGWLALPADNKNEPVALNSTKQGYLDKQLQCNASERFTYYSQPECEGVDIDQMHGDSPESSALGITTVYSNTTLEKYAQANGRMRKLKERQGILTVVDKASAKLIDSTGAQLTLDSLERYLRQNSQKVLENKLFPAANMKVHSAAKTAARQYLLQLAVDPSKKIDEAFERLQDFFVTQRTQLDILHQYARKAKEISTQRVLQRHIQRNSEQLKQFQAYDAQSRQILEKAKGNCPEKTWYSASNDSDMQVQQISQQLQQQQQIVSNQQTEYSDEKKFLKPLNFSWFTDFSLVENNLVNTLLSAQLQGECWIPDFKRNLFVSPNFLETYFRGDVLICKPHSKLALVVYFSLQVDESKTANLTAVVCATEDADHFLANKAKDKLHSWISSVDGYDLSTRPQLDPQQTNEVSAVLEQVAFLFGRVDALLAMKQHQFLIDDAKIEEKLNFFKYAVLENPAFAISSSEWQNLQIKLFPVKKFIMAWVKSKDQERFFPEGCSDMRKKELHKLYDNLRTVDTAIDDNLAFSKLKISEKFQAEVLSYYHSQKFLQHIEGGQVREAFNYLLDKNLTDSTLYLESPPASDYLTTIKLLSDNDARDIMLDFAFVHNSETRKKLLQAPQSASQLIERYRNLAGVDEISGKITRLNLTIDKKLLTGEWKERLARCSHDDEFKLIVTLLAAKVEDFLDQAIYNWGYAKQLIQTTGHPDGHPDFTKAMVMLYKVGKDNFFDKVKGNEFFQKALAASEDEDQTWAILILNCVNQLDQYKLVIDSKDFCLIVDEIYNNHTELTRLLGAAISLAKANGTDKDYKDMLGGCYPKFLQALAETDSNDENKAKAILTLHKNKIEDRYDQLNDQKLIQALLSKGCGDNIALVVKLHSLGIENCYEFVTEQTFQDAVKKCNGDDKLIKAVAILRDAQIENPDDFLFEGDFKDHLTDGISDTDTKLCYALYKADKQQLIQKLKSNSGDHKLFVDAVVKVLDDQQKLKVLIAIRELQKDPRFGAADQQAGLNKLANAVYNLDLSQENWKDSCKTTIENQIDTHFSNRHWVRRAVIDCLLITLLPIGICVFAGRFLSNKGGYGLFSQAKTNRQIAAEKSIIPLLASCGGTAGRSA